MQRPPESKDLFEEVEEITFRRTRARTVIADIAETAGQTRSPRSAATTFEDNRDHSDFDMRRGQAESMLLGLLSANDADDVSLASSDHTPQFELTERADRVRCARLSPQQPPPAE